MLDSRFIWFSASNEDTASEIEALAIRPGSSVLCVTASGSRALDLLATEAASIVAIDANPAQTALAELKIASARGLAHAQWLAFLGIGTCGDRRAMYRSIRRHLSSGARSFWDAHPDWIEAGVLLCGKWEGYFRSVQGLWSPTRRDAAQRLLSFEDVAEQYAFWRARWDGPAWRLFLRCITSRWLWRYVMRDPATRFVPSGFPVYEYVRDRFDRAARTTFLRRSPFAVLLFNGNYRADLALPWYLRAASFERVRAGAARIRLVTDSLGRYLADAATPTFDAFSLSDFSSYCALDGQDEVWRGVVAHASAGARVCERKYVNKTESRVLADARVTRERTLERQLAETDLSFFYTFVIASIRLSRMSDARAVPARDAIASK